MLEHGGNLRDAVQQFARPAHDWVDLSTGLNPHFYPVPTTLVRPQHWHRLPEPSAELLLAAQAFYQAPQLLAVAGTQAAIQALPHLRPPGRVVVSAPSYAEHAFQWRQAARHQVSEVAYAQLEQALPDADVMVVCNPNNPTGALIARPRLLEWAAHLRRRGGWLIVDEAFGDMHPEHSVAAESAQPGLIVLRSVGKFFGLAGIRLGFVGAHEQVLRPLAQALGPWTVSGAAQVIAQAALSDQAWQEATRAHLAQQGQRLHQLLAAYGLQAQGTALFQWCSDAALQGRTEALWQHLAQHGIWTRLFRDAARGLRFGLPPDQAAWQRLATCLAKWHAIGHAIGHASGQPGSIKRNANGLE